MESVSCHGCELVTVGSLGSLCEEIGKEKKEMILPQHETELKDFHL